jgi:hypothetical protein
MNWLRRQGGAAAAADNGKLRDVPSDRTFYAPAFRPHPCTNRPISRGVCTRSSQANWRVAKPPNLTAGAAGLNEPASALNEGSRSHARANRNNHNSRQRRAGDDRKHHVGCPGASSLIASSVYFAASLDARHVE